MDPIERGVEAEDEDVTELTVNFAATARILFSVRTVSDTLAQVVALAVATIDGCDFAGLSLVDGESVPAPAQSDPIVLLIDALQQATGEGPCTSAAIDRRIVYANDLVDDTRWPHFGPEAAAAGIRSALALPLTANGRSGTLNCYARFPDAFSALDRAKAVILASLAGLALRAAHSHEDVERRTENLQAALVARETIGQAQGVLMERERITADQAFDILRRASQYLRRTLAEVAHDLLDSGQSPVTGPYPTDRRSGGQDRRAGPGGDG